MTCEDFYCMFCGLLGTGILLFSYAYAWRHRRPLEPPEPEPPDDDNFRFGSIPRGAIHIYDSVRDEDYYMIVGWNNHHAKPKKEDEIEDFDEFDDFEV